MRKIQNLLALLLTSLSLVAFSQPNGGKVSGTVVDGSAKTIEAATITLLRAKDSSVAKLSVADRTGHYTFEGIGDGKYLVSISATGHQRGFSEVFEINAANPQVTLKTIELIPQAKTIEGVTVTSRKPLIEQKIDRTIVNVEASVTAVGNSALEVLEKAPGVSVDKDGNISLKGKSGVVIYIDGRPSYLSGADLSNLLRSMSASQLEQIEIMTNPPAKYDAAGNSGVINIRTKKNRQFGSNGSVTTGYTQGNYARFNENVNFNYRAGKVNVFTNLSYNRNHRGQRLDINRNFLQTGTKTLLSHFDQVTHMQQENDFLSGKIGLDYSASKRTTLGVVVNGFRNPGLWQSQTYTSIFDPAGNLTAKTRAVTSNDDLWKNFNTNFNLRTQLDSAGQELTADLDYIQYRSTSTQPLNSYYYDAAGNFLNGDLLLGDLPQSITIYSAKADYTLPLKKDAKFEAGWKSSYVKTDNNANYDTVRNGQYYHDFNRSNHFLYEENINAAYVNLSKQFSKKWSGQLGLRAENTNANGNQLTTQVRFSRHYTQLFPTAYVQYSANEKNQFVLNYGRRINRPDYESLNPFIHFLDRYTFEQGNPNLRPQFSHNIEFTHTYGGFLNTTLNYSKTTDIIQQVLEQNEVTNETFIKQANIASSRQYGVAVSAQVQVKKWWTGSVYANLYNNHFTGVVNNDQISIGVTTWLAQIQQQFKWGKGWAAEVSGFYRSKGLEGVIFIRSLAQVNAGLSKQVLKSKGTVRLNARDIFRQQIFKGYSKYSNVDAQFMNDNDNRTVGISFTYRFSKGKLKAGNTRRSGGADDEQGRVRGGSN